MIYRSKKDAWLVGLVVAAIIIPLLIGFYNLFAPGGHARAGWSAVLVGATTWAVVLWMTYPLYYEITPAELKIRCGLLIRQHIPLAAIEGVSPTRNPAGAPAWSLDRLRVNYRMGGESGVALISPADKKGFLGELAAAAGLEWRGDRIVRVR